MKGFRSELNKKRKEKEEKNKKSSTHAHTPHEKLLMELFLVPCRSHQPVTNVFCPVNKSLDGRMGQRCYKYRFKTVSAMQGKLEKYFVDKTSDKKKNEIKKRNNVTS